MELIVLSILFGVGIAFALGGGSDGGGGSGGDPGFTDGPDVITGTEEADRLTSGAGDDTVNGLGGDDQIFLGPGRDVANGGEGDDEIFGEGGGDVVTGGPGNDRIFLGDGFDESTEFVLDGVPQDLGDDLIRGGADNDVITDTHGSNQIFGEEGADVIFAVDNIGVEGQPDILSGGFGTDLIFGDDGDIITGGAREDTFVAVFDEANDDPVTITDYDPATETLTFDFHAGEFPALTNGDLSSTYSPVQQIVRILVDAGSGPVVVAVLENQPAAIADLAAAGITLRMV